VIEGTFEERGSQSTEKVTQEEREKSALGAVYMFPTQIPDSPSEPPQPPPDDPDIECKMMMLGDEVDGLTNEQPASTANITDLLASLPSQMPGLSFGSQSTANTTQLTGADVSLLSNFLQSMQQQGNFNTLMQQFPTSSSEVFNWDGQQQLYQSGNSSTVGWDGLNTDWGAGKGQHNGRGGGGRNKRRPCKYFAQGL
jgi:protein phosphatase 1 regulatory subunit 10